ncbi:MAG: DivIVA domain-containing protein [Ignavibacteriales bacterium]|nr:DivIVA domain-containing protein [Ignavibacteriales bacterium]MBI3789069.1 DivIVA domain-containing protein [Ignavibacteriales bacterium]
MKITPLEIKRQQFKKVMRGYDPVEVDTFLDMLSNEMEEALTKNKELRDKLIEIETQLKDYKNMEKTLQQTLLQAQETSGKEIENSKKEADLIVQEAELKASQIVDKARMDFSRMKEEISNLKSRKESILSRLKVLLSSEVDLIRALEIDDDDSSRQDNSKGTGKDHLQIDEILKKL